jgi:hypothetical protein
MIIYNDITKETDWYKVRRKDVLQHGGEDVSKHVKIVLLEIVVEILLQHLKLLAYNGDIKQIWFSSHRWSLSHVN